MNDTLKADKINKFSVFLLSKAVVRDAGADTEPGVGSLLIMDRGDVDVYGSNGKKELVHRNCF